MSTEEGPLSGASPTPGAQAEREPPVSLPPLLSGNREKSGSGELFPPAGWGEGRGLYRSSPQGQWGPMRREGGERAVRGVPTLASILYVGLRPEVPSPGVEQPSSDLSLHWRTLNKHPSLQRLPLDTLTSGPPSGTVCPHDVPIASSSRQIIHR